MSLMKASIAHGIRPTALILGKDSGKPWNRMDILFAKAYQQFLNELCDQCGRPEYICHNDDNRIQIDAKLDECEIAKVTERKQAELTEANKKNPLALKGTRVYGLPRLTDEALEEGLEFVDLRLPYYRERAKRLGLVPDNLSE